MPETPVRYLSSEEDSVRWLDFPFRSGDIVISTRSKSGTTWMQMICALLIFRTPQLPAPLGRISPWLDWLITSRQELFAELEAQQHRRFVKTHTPLDGIVIDPRATYIVVARSPLDAAVSLYHQSANIDRERVRQLTGAPAPEGSPRAPKPLREWLLGWMESKADPRVVPDSLPGFLWHATDAWARREEPNILLVHYDDLQADLAGQMRRIAQRLGVPEPEPALVEAATFEQMRARSDQLIPGLHGVLKSSQAFFRRGRSGSAREILSMQELARYRERIAGMGPGAVSNWPGAPVPADLISWLERG